MKLKLFFFSFLTSLFSMIYAQNPSAGEVKLPVKYRYCEIIVPNGVVYKGSVVVDFGQEVRWFKSRRLVDENGKPIRFNSVVDALNYMGDLGWEFQNTYVLKSGESTTELHYVMRQTIQPEI